MGEFTPEQEREVQDLLGPEPVSEAGGRATPPVDTEVTSSPPGVSTDGSGPLPPGPDAAKPGFFERLFHPFRQWKRPKDRRQKKAVSQERDLAKRLWGIVLDGVARRAGDKWKPTNKELDALSETTVDFINTIAPAVLDGRQAQIGLPLVLVAYIAARADLSDVFDAIGGIVSRLVRLILGRRKPQAVADARSSGHGENDDGTPRFVPPPPVTPT